MSDPTNPNDTPAPAEASPPPGVTERPTGTVVTDPRAVREAEIEAAAQPLRDEIDSLRAELAAARVAARDAEHQQRQVVDVDDVVELPDVERGDWVTVVHRDPQVGPPVDVARVGQIVRVVEVGSGPAVVVAWVDGGGLSDPIPLDHRVHGRVDAPRVVIGA